MKTSEAWIPYLSDVIFTSLFAYLIFDSLMVLWIGGYTSRISLFSYLIPHASKVLFWSSAALLWLRLKFGWRFGWAMILLYCIAELITNAIYVPVHIYTDPGYLFRVLDPVHNYYFIASNLFFIFSIYIAMQYMRGHFHIKFDWSILPFVGFVCVWVAQGYVTDSTLLIVNPLIELYEFLWSILYINAAIGVFRPKSERDWIAPAFPS